MQFILTGFTQQLGFRVFSFEGKRQDQTKAAYTVKADLGLIRKYGIRVQELPLLCRAMLDMTTEDEEQHAWTYGEAEMSHHEKTSVAARIAAVAKKRFARRPPATSQGIGWRAPQAASEPILGEL